MEFVLELLFDIIVEGSIELGSEKKVPMPIRIISLLIVWAVFFGMGGLFLYEAYLEYLNHSNTYILLGAIGLFMVIGGIFIAYKMFKKKREQENEAW